ncbi:MAG TPA: DNA-formamidopyrimidine glycosylase family protein, partial [Candidatus Saccharimonas sp.]|nr:DNA-formamidopyrimidine glycosylase family protein [Candidatus Saccharimonas sp.]
MPEGPEVETIRRGLEVGLVGQRIAGVEVLWPKCFPAPAEDVTRLVVGAGVRHVGRRGKVL